MAYLGNKKSNHRSGGDKTKKSRPVDARQLSQVFHLCSIMNIDQYSFAPLLLSFAHLHLDIIIIFFSNLSFKLTICDLFTTYHV